MIVQLNALRVGEIEMSRGEFMLMNHPTEEMFRSARTKLDRAGIRCVSYYTATIKEDQDIEDAVRFARLLGSSNVTGDATGSIMNRIDRRFTEEQLTFGIHNHYLKGREIRLRESGGCAERSHGTFQDRRGHGRCGTFRILRP